MSTTLQDRDAALLAARIERNACLPASHLPLLREFARHTTPADRHARFFFPRALDTDDALLSALSPLTPGAETIWTLTTGGRLTAVANLVRLPSGDAEFALLVRSDLQHRGLGSMLVQLSLERARTLGCRRLCGLVAADNLRMRQMTQKFEFHSATASGDTIEIWRDICASRRESAQGACTVATIAYPGELECR